MFVMRRNRRSVRNQNRNDRTPPENRSHLPENQSPVTGSIVLPLFWVWRDDRVYFRKGDCIFPSQLSIPQTLNASVQHSHKEFGLAQQIYHLPDNVWTVGKPHPNCLIRLGEFQYFNSSQNYTTHRITGCRLFILKCVDLLGHFFKIV